MSSNHRFSSIYVWLSLCVSSLFCFIPKPFLLAYEQQPCPLAQGVSSCVPFPHGNLCIHLYFFALRVQVGFLRFSTLFGNFERPHVAYYYVCNWSFTAVSESPSTPVITGMPISFTMSADGSGGEFHIDLSSKPERRKSRPPRPPPPGRRLSGRPVSEIQNENEAVDGIRPRTTSVPNMDSGPPDSISCVRFACTFTKKNGELPV